jgi:hypothetical protein
MGRPPNRGVKKRIFKKFEERLYEDHRRGGAGSVDSVLDRDARPHGAARRRSARAGGGQRQHVPHRPACPAMAISRTCPIRPGATVTDLAPHARARKNDFKMSG